MKVLKSLLLAIHTLAIFFPVCLLLSHLGLNPFNLHPDPRVRIGILALVLLALYLLSALILAHWLPKVREWPFKAGWVGILLILGYSVSFAWAQVEPNAWRVYFILNAPVGLSLKNLLASEFTFPIQLLLALTVFAPILGQKWGYGLDAWMARKTRARQKNLSQR